MLVYVSSHKQRLKVEKDQTQSNRGPTKKTQTPKSSSWAKLWMTEKKKKKRNLQGQQKWLPQRVFIPGVHGKNPSGTAATASHGSSWKVLPEGGEANDLIVKKVNCSPAERQKAQEELHHGVWDISKYLTDFSIMKNLRPLFFFFFFREVLFFHPPPTRHTPIRPPDWPVSLFGPWEFKAGPLGAAQCVLTPCNEISSCC